MKRLIISITLLVLCLYSFAHRDINFSTKFQAGSLGDICQINDSLFMIFGKEDPKNPIDTALEPSTNWYFYRMTGVKDKKVCLLMPGNNLTGASFSYDCLGWQHFSPGESTDGFLSFRHPKDTIYIATFIPYTYHYHQARMAQWTKSRYVQIDSIGQSVEGRPLQLLHITDESGKAKKRIWIHGRIHPSETPSSYLLDAIISKLLDDSSFSAELRQKAEFFILPIANPDGVAKGLSRSNADGVNLEINYNRPQDSTCVEVKAIKAAFEKLTSDAPFDIALNNHSQLSEEATFWIHTDKSTSTKYLKDEKRFAQLCCKNNPYMTMQDMEYSDLAPRYAEGWFWNNFRERTLALTIETPHSYYSSGEYVTTDNLKIFGDCLLQAIAEYLNICIN